MTFIKQLGLALGIILIMLTLVAAWYAILGVAIVVISFYTSKFIISIRKEFHE